MLKDLFVEVFPIEAASIPNLTAYQVRFDESKGSAHYGKLAYRLNRTFPGGWLWTDDRIVTDTAASPMQMEITVDVLRQELPDLYKHLLSVEEDPRWHVSAQAAADYVLYTHIRNSEHELEAALKAFGARLPNAYILREQVIKAWLVDGLPAISIGIHSHLCYEQDAQTWATQAGAESLVGLAVMDMFSMSMIGTIKRFDGQLGAVRQRLLDLSRRDAMQKLLKAAPDEDSLVTVETLNQQDYQYPARALRLLIRPHSTDWERFNVEPEKALKALYLSPDTRARIVRTVSDVLKQKKLIDNAYSTRNQADLFSTMEFMPSMLYGKKRSRIYKPENLLTDFMQSGIYARHPRFQTSPIRLAVINTLDSIASDFIEAMRRKIEKDYDFRLDVIKERQVKVLSEANLASAIRAVEKENPHLVLAFFPDAKGGLHPDADYLKSLTLGKGIASHVIYESTMNEAELMDLVIMAVLAKTGNTPYILTEALEYCDYVVGLDLVRESHTRGDKVLAMARIYRNDGQFLQYVIESVELARDEHLPFALLQTLFPESLFKKKRVIIHYDGNLPDDLLKQLFRWADGLHSHFYPVEIQQKGVPHLYALTKTISQAPWGSIFFLNQREAFVIASYGDESKMLEPLAVRVPLSNLAIGQAVYSVLAWTLLDYAALGKPQLPVTIQHADDMEHWLARGMMPSQTTGDIAFWL